MLKGKILKLDTGLVVVPYKRTAGDTYDCVVVRSNNNYDVGGFNLSMFVKDLEGAREMGLVYKNKEKSLD